MVNVILIKNNFKILKIFLLHFLSVRLIFDEIESSLTQITFWLPADGGGEIEFPNEIDYGR